MSSKFHLVLIIPPSVFLLDERVFMSLGILRVAAMVRELGHDVQVLDLSGVPDYLQVLSRAIDNSKTTTLFGVTATTPQMPAVKQIIEVIHSMGRQIILGGPHSTLIMGSCRRGVVRAINPAQQLIKLADVVVAGDGELTIEPAMMTLVNQGRGVIDVDDPKSPGFITMDRVWPWPARDLIDVESYRYTIDGKKALSLIGQLGCVMGCNFCSGRLSPTFRRMRLRSTNDVVAEVRHLIETYKVGGLMFYDDEVNINRAFDGLMDGLVQLQDDLGVKLAMRACVKAELFTPHQAAKMSKAGFHWILVGFEAGSNRILTNINKKATKAENTQCIEIAHEHGIKVKALMSLGHPGESQSTIDETAEWVLKVRPDDVDFTIITPYPGCPYFDQTVEIGPGTWVFTSSLGDRLYSHDVDYITTADYYKGVPGHYSSHVWTDNLTAEALVSRRDEIEASVRQNLSLGPKSKVALDYDHSMGMSHHAISSSTCP